MNQGGGGGGGLAGRKTYDGQIAGLYDLGDTLGRGHFAVVKLARHVFTGEQVAVKVIDKTKLDEVSRAHLFQEVRCMKLVQHPNVVRLYEVIDTQTKLYLVLELGDGGDMYDHIMKHEGGLDESSARNYFRQIVHAIAYCHRLHVVHRDLKPENVVFFRKLGMVKLTDFGFSNRFCPGQKLETSCGSLAYSAPEILLGDSYDAPAVDVWSLGVILFMLVCGQAPFQEANDSETLTMIMDCKYTVPSHVSQDCSSLIRRMLIRDPERRATLEQIAGDPWLATDGQPELTQPTQYLPLVSRELVSEEEHAHIIQKMVAGNIATQEDIQDSLDQNVYNHISATYFLLAERKLRALRHEKAKLLDTTTHGLDLAALAISPRNASLPDGPSRDDALPRTVDSLLSPQEKRKALALASMPRSLDELQRCACRTPRPHNTRANSVNNPLTTNSTLRDITGINGDGTTSAATTIDDPSKDNSGSAVDCSTDGPPPGWPASTAQPSAVSRFKSTPAHNRRLHSVRSSPQLTLNEIHEEGESEGEVPPTAARTSPLVSAAGSPRGQAELGGTKFERRRCYAAKARSTASCSSSDATTSDEDSADPRHLKRKADKAKRGAGSTNRRPGADDDEEDGRGGSAGGHQPGGASSPAPGAAQDSPPTPPPPPSSEGGGCEPGSSDATQRRHCDGRVSPTVSSVSSLATHSLAGGDLSSVPPSPQHSPSPSPAPSPFRVSAGGSLITSLRSSKTLSQLNRFISSSPPSLLGSPTLDDKENGRPVGGRGALGRNCPGPLHHLLHLRRRPPSCPSSSLSSSRLSVGSSLDCVTVTGGGGVGSGATSTSAYTKHSSLYRLLKHAPSLGPKRWDMNRNGLDKSRASSRVASRVASATSATSAAPACQSPSHRKCSASELAVVTASAPSSPASSHSKCCSLC